MISPSVPSAIATTITIGRPISQAVVISRSDSGTAILIRARVRRTLSECQSALKPGERMLTTRPEDGAGATEHAERKRKGR